MNSLIVFRSKAFASPLLTLSVLGMMGGLPLALTGSTLFIWLQETGFSLGAIGLMQGVNLAYGFKFLWAPFLDHFGQVSGITDAKFDRNCTRMARFGYIMTVQFFWKSFEHF